MTNIDPLRLGLSGGVISGIFMLVITLFALLTGYGLNFIALAKNLLPGYELSFFGSLLGAFWGFVCCFIWLYALAYLYNLLRSE